MKNNRIVTAVLCLLLTWAITLNFASCAVNANAQDLMSGVRAHKVKPLNDVSSQSESYADFAVRLFKAGHTDGENTLISPLSVMYALSMVSNGAEGETLQQMEAVLGMPVDELNIYLYTYMQSLQKNDTFKVTNSIWFNEEKGFKANRDFLQKNADYYGAKLNKAPFNEQTRKDINDWVRKNTNEQIPEMLSKIDEDTLMLLANTLSFDAKWPLPFEERQLKEGKFTLEDGTQRDATFMNGSSTTYFETDDAVGFMKRYYGGDYGFVAMLPNEGVSLSDYVATLDGKALRAMLESPAEYTNVHFSIPKFETESDIKLVEILGEMGMPNAFDVQNAELGKIGTLDSGDKLYIDSVVHKTHILVDEKGTKAAASTGIGIAGGAAGTPEQKYVYLDRPFVYMIVDCKNHVPLFIGTMTDTAG